MELISRAVVLALMAVLASDFFVADGYPKFLWSPLALCPPLLRLAPRIDVLVYGHGTVKRRARSLDSQVPRAAPV